MRISDWSSDVCSSDLSAMVNGRGWSNQVSIVSLTSSNSQFPERPEQDRLLRMDAVFGFVPHARLRPVDHRIDHLVAPVRGQAMEENRVALDRKSTRMNTSHSCASRNPASAITK